MSRSVVHTSKDPTRKEPPLGTPPESTPLTPAQRLWNRLEGEMKQVDAVIIAQMQSDVALIPQLGAYLIGAGGKRLRPLLCLATAELTGYTGTRHYPLSACVEFIHTATLLHDDVVDESVQRRGQESANSVWGNQASVLVGDFLFSRSFEIMVEDGSLEVLKLLSHASARLAEGEVHQLMTTNNLETSTKDYLDVVGAKTAVLFAASARLGAVVSDRPEVEKEALSAFGTNLGVAFQLVDDCLDYQAVQEELGKTIGDDFQEGKMTLPVIYALEKADTEERAFWTRTLEGLNQRDGDFQTALEYLQKHKALTYTLDQAQIFTNKAKESLSIFPESSLKTILVELCDYVVSRGS